MAPPEIREAVRGDQVDGPLPFHQQGREALEPGGLLVVADALVYPDGPERERMMEDLFAHMARNGISASEAAVHLGQWAEEDFYVPLPDELRLIADAGFPRPDVFWRDGLIAVYGAFKSE